MIFLWGGARPLRSAWLGFHLLLWTALATTGGELCRFWASGGEKPDGAFECRGRPDTADPKFCCGTCRAPFCCASEELRLDQTQCPDGPPAKKIVAAPRTAIAPGHDLPVWALVLIIIVSIILLIPFSCGVSHLMGIIYRRLISWWESRHQAQPNNPQPAISTPPMDDEPFHIFPPFAFDVPPRYSVVFPDGPPEVSSAASNGLSSATSNGATSNGLPAAQSGHANEGYQEDEAQSGPSCPSEPALATGGSLPSQLCASNLAPPPLNDEEALGARRRRSASVGCVPPTCSDAPPPYSEEDPYVHQALAPRGNPQARSAARGNPQVRKVESCDDLSEAASTVPPEDPPPDSGAVSCDSQASPDALDSLPVVQFRRAAQGAAEDEVIIGSPPALLDSAAGGPPLEPGLKEE